jgi:TRAP-type C4-dicarboxylate transport system permease small subunit
MRSFLDRLYLFCGGLAACCMVGLLTMVLLGIVDRTLFRIPFKGTDSYAGYLMAGAGFLALAYTFGRNEHIRVTLVLNALKGKKRFALEMWALSAGVLLTGLFAFYAVRFAWQSHTMHDISTGMDATPLWLPQIPMAVGCVVLFIAFVDQWLQTLRRGEAQADAAQTRNE